MTARSSVLVVLIGFVLASCATPASELPTAETSVGDIELTVLVAESLTQRSRGLKGLEAIPGGADGMLFVFDRPTITSFTMEDTLIPLDIWFFDEAGNLIASDTMVPCSEAECPDYQPESAITWALETPAGEFTFTTGDRISTIEND